MSTNYRSCPTGRKPARAAPPAGITAASPREERRQLPQADRLDSFALGISVVARIHDEGALRIEVFPRVVEAPVELRREAALDLDRPQLSARHLQHQVDFGAGGRSVEARPHPLRCRAEQVFHHEPFPASAGDRMTQHGVPVVEAEQRVDDAAVAHMDLRRFHQALADVGMEGRQAPHQQEVDEQVEIAGDRLAVDAEAARELSRVERAALRMGQHGPEAAQRFRRHARPELRDVAFQVRADEILPPDGAGRVALREKAVGEAAPDPEFLARIAADFEDVERPQLDIGNAAGQGFARLPEQVDGRRAQQQEAARPDAAAPPPVDQAAKRLEQFRHSLDLIQDHQLVFMAGQVKGGIGQLLAVRRVLEVEIDARPPFGDEPGQRGLARLTRAEQGHRRELVQPGADEP